jgi:hypothetical protein
MIGADTTLLVQLDTQYAAILWTSGVRQLLTANPADFRLFGFQILTA